MSVTIHRSFAPLTSLALVTREDMEQIGYLARERILRRTKRGVGPNGEPFAAYSEGYAKARAKAGLATEPVALEVSGEMLRAITVVAGEKIVTLGFG